MAKTKQELKKELTEWIDSQKWENKKFFSIPIQKFVDFSKKGMQHTASRNYKYPEIELQIAKNIMKILPNSHYMGYSSNTDKKRPEVKGTHNYFDIVSFSGELYEVWFKVKETRDKTYFYDHGIIRKL